MLIAEREEEEEEEEGFGVFSSVWKRNVTTFGVKGMWLAKQNVQLQSLQDFANKNNSLSFCDKLRFHKSSSLFVRFVLRLFSTFSLFTFTERVFSP